ncbi:MAG: riboflavin synthase [Candidatus Adiutrix sp.]
MFTGLTLGLGEIKRKRPLGDEFELLIAADFIWDAPLTIGESIAVSGVCLTVTSAVGAFDFTAHASAETLGHSTLGGAKKVNLERALTLNSRLGGHLVTGHIDTLGTVLSVNRKGESLICEFSLDEPSLMALVVPKGSITIDGVSLTVNQTTEETFSVNLIPHTASMTTIASLSLGHKVNIETDIIGKYVQKLLGANNAAPKPKGLSVDFLAKHGFFSG